ncbi:MAG: DUF2752 domain-containing protein [Chlorobi bacterium]|nr:DUF2752 domain-containing protein [Chlorobiota bacterium]
MSPLQGKFCPDIRHPYQVLNLVMAILLGLVFIYAAIFSVTKDNHPVPSVYNKMMLRPSPTTGLSRSFSAMVRGDFAMAGKWNPYGPRIFMFFFLEMIMRGVAFAILCKRIVPVKTMMTIDVILTVVLFVTAYGKLLFFWNYF